MARIFSHPPSADYDAGWDSIFGSKKEGLKELTELTEEFGGYDTETSVDVDKSRQIVTSDPRVGSTLESLYDENGERAELETLVAELPTGAKQLPGGGVRLPRRTT